MINDWILDKLNPLQNETTVILKDPQRIIRPGDYILDEWSLQHGFTTLMCTGNLALRSWYENLRGDPDIKLLLVDRSRVNAKRPRLFYPDLQAQATPQTQLTISLRDFLIEQTGDENWPLLINHNRQISDLMLAHLSSILKTHQDLRVVSPSRFSDQDFYKILFGAMLKINPFEKLSPAKVRKLCIEQSRAFKELETILPADVMETFSSLIQQTEPPFNLLLGGDAVQIMRAFNLAAILHQHGLDYSLIIGNLDPVLMPYREIDPAFLNLAMQDQIGADPDQVLTDVKDLEDHLQQSPKAIEDLFKKHLQVEDLEAAFLVLKREKLSEMVRRTALYNLYIELFRQDPNLKFHKNVLKILKTQENDNTFLVLRRPSPVWETLLELYQHTIDYFSVLAKLGKTAMGIKHTPAAQLDVLDFVGFWNKDQLNRLEYYAAKVNRQMRVGDIHPLKKECFWESLKTRWEVAHQYLKKLNTTGDQILALLDARFQDVYHKHYTDWIKDSESPLIFTHQFLERIFRKYWDPKGNQKAYVLVFDGMRTDAWDLFLKPVFETRFQVVQEYPASAILPTETNLSRKAISAGCLPESFPKSTRESALLAAWLEKTLGYKVKFNAIKDDDTENSGITVWYQSEKLDYIVFNFSDENLHHNNQELSLIYESTVDRIIREDVQAVLRDIPDNAVIFVTSDHGFTTMPQKAIPVPESLAPGNDTKYRCMRAQERFTVREEDVITFAADQMAIPTSSTDKHSPDFRYVIFPRPNAVFQRSTGRHDPDRYSHGGLTMAECLIPMVVINGKEKKEPLFQFDSVRQVNMSYEGEAVELDIVVRSTQMIVQDTLMTFSFNAKNMPPHREVITTPKKRITVRWVPDLPQITPEQQQSGQIEIPLLVKMSYLEKNKEIVSTYPITVRVRIQQDKLRRKLDSKLDLMMGKIPKTFNG
ncbi:MAG: hypothetical protein CL609_24110 [Anaerolineaceae bacterium]|nr:hypothetical protein [Anaerolineaceae bacterium]